jgi:hypothetical protein
VAHDGLENGRRSCPDCGEPLEDGYCSCGYDDDDDDDFDRDELGDDPEED